MISISILTTKSEADKAYVVKFFCNLVFTNLTPFAMKMRITYYYIIRLKINRIFKN